MANPLNSPKFRSYLAQLGVEVIEDMRENLRNPPARQGLRGSYRRPAIATGSLYDSLQYRVVQQGSTYVLEIYGEEHWFYVDRGRSPGRQPPLSAIQAWVRVKGLTPNAAFAIARKIGEFGTSPTHFASEAIEQADKELGDKIEKEVFPIIHEIAYNLIEQELGELIDVKRK